MCVCAALPSHMREEHSATTSQGARASPQPWQHRSWQIAFQRTLSTSKWPSECMPLWLPYTSESHWLAKMEKWWEMTTIDDGCWHHLLSISCHHSLKALSCAFSTPLCVRVNKTNWNTATLSRQLLILGQDLPVDQRGGVPSTWREV